MMTFTQMLNSRFSRSGRRSVDRFPTANHYVGRALATTALAALLGCGSEGSDVPTAPEQPTEPVRPVPVFTSVSLDPASSIISILAPLNTIRLAAAPLDQNGQPMAGIGEPSFTSDEAGVATVGSDGTVTAVAVGSSGITVSFTSGGVTRIERATVDVTTEFAEILIGTWAGTVDGSFGPSTMTMVLNAGGGMSSVGDTGLYRCRLEGVWRVTGADLIATGREVACQGTEVIFTAPLSAAVLEGRWSASSGTGGTFSLRKR
jgi:hypothetical protein